jgi:hypothetical protein
MQPAEETVHGLQGLPASRATFVNLAISACGSVLFEIIADLSLNLGLTVSDD